MYQAIKFDKRVINILKKSHGAVILHKSMFERV